MAVNELKKINVRSPYYISVAKPVSEGGEGSEPDTSPTETLVLSRDTSCGATEQIGVDVGTRKYKISAANRDLGNYQITFSNIKVPIKYRIGHEGNMPSFSTAGLDSFAEAWTLATGETPTLSSASANPNGVSATATYYATQSDIDTYGTTITLEIQQPLITEGYSFVSSCPAATAEQEPSTTGFVTVLTVAAVAPYAMPSGMTLSINGTSLGTVPTNTGDATRYIFSDISPDLIPKTTTGNVNFVKAYPNLPHNFSGSEYNYAVQSSFDTSVVYKAENTLSRGRNQLTITRLTNTDRANITMSVTRHPVADVNGTYRILGTADGQTMQTAEAQYYFRSGSGHPTQINFYWDGGNTNELSNVSLDSATVVVRTTSL